jgi:hypothetical protein
MREWAQTIRAVDEKVDRALRDGLFELEHERRVLVTDSVDDGAECLEEVGGWAGTRVSGALAARIRTADPPLTIVQEIRLRLLLKPV